MYLGSRGGATNFSEMYPYVFVQFKSSNFMNELVERKKNKKKKKKVKSNKYRLYVHIRAFR